MKHVGLLDNFSNYEALLATPPASRRADQVMQATGGNTGNLAFVHAVRLLLADEPIRFGWHIPPNQARLKLSHLVICCANQLGPHTDLGNWADRLRALQVPVVLIGLGAQSDSLNDWPKIPVGTQRFLQVANRLRWNADSPNILVRGSFSQEVLRRMGIESVAGGCPSCLISPVSGLGQEVLRRQEQALEHPQQAACRVAVAGGNPWHGSSAFLEPRLFELAERAGSAYVLQHPELLFSLAMQLPVAPQSAASLNQLLSLHQGRFDEAAMREWLGRHSRFFIDVPSWMAFCAEQDLALGPRYHGVALAVQAGVPGCVFSIDSRTEELARTTGIKQLPVASLTELSAQALVEASRWTSEDAEALDKARQINRGLYLDFVASNGLRASAHLQNMQP